MENISRGLDLAHKKTENISALPLNQYAAQAVIAKYAFHQSNPDYRGEVEGNTAMRWWLKEGHAHRFGLFIENHPAKMINPNNEESLAEIWEEIKKETIH